MEWPKVESRCPLYKRRFETISKTDRLAAGVDLRWSRYKYKKHDQIYPPSEEELRIYLDPYENVTNVEMMNSCYYAIFVIHQHTYCVGLGREVPEGSWYCDGCRPVAIGFSCRSKDNKQFIQ
ncbi:uncharacterized protein LOC120124737 [Hibiscus syriacus]|uniref:uncharacterized protein LOC120124737 n=1 Tax=Hibiscus syriacus TaxID=106335 RepID=UPI0019228D5A|nr:uncharacterized protein LOC120124737 [Hibiscus syriacus]XP_038999268.1 uncharacterized protein LOC120124737 [Hibiscus syriacus]